ncbi:hypothetical protein [Microterricola pindariensis]|uniref:Uncharacterized protein n=1 Tax=Microterricola pindariensis TaxID=478010 RepID=A0ABX5AY63_9MICO|nr:hypothetical protein [Microterricola pindariensis]PPL19403.1 hypothetical protein GY24_06215 [Microterricola pindariensis]
MDATGRWEELIVRLSCAAPAAECADTNPGALAPVDALSALIQLAALVAVALVIVFVVRARRQR